MRALPRWLSSLVFLLLLLAAPAAAREVRIGVPAHRGAAETLRDWQPTADYLAARLPVHRFTIVPLDPAGVRRAVARDQLDFLVTNPALYVELEVRRGVTRTATLVNAADGGVGAQFGAVVFTRADRTDLATLKNLKGKTFMAVEADAFGGWLVARHELQRKGILPRDFKALRFGSYSYDKVVLAVQRGEVDAGCVRTGTLERLAAEGRIRLADFKILNPRQAEGFPFLLSTALYPEYAFARLRHTDNELSRKVTALLLLMPATSPAARTARVGGWTTPLNYQPVHQVLQALHAPPYEQYGKVTLTRALRQHWQFALTVVVLLLILTLTATKALRLAGRLQSLSAGLEQQVRERTQKLAASEERLRLALTAANQGLYDLNVQTGEAQVSPEYATMLGYDPAGFHETNASWIERLHPDDHDSVTATYRDYIAGRIPVYRVEFRQRTRWGNWIWILSLGKIVEYDDDGRPLRMVGTHTDITERKQAEEALIESEHRYRLLFEANPLPMWVYDLETLRFLAVNDAAVSHYGYRRD